VVSQPQEDKSESAIDGGFGVVGRSLRGAASVDVLERLTEVGFLASECCLHASAEAIFASLATIRPNNPSPLIASATVRARRGEVDAAVEQLRGVIERHPDSEMAKAVLGMVLVSSGRHGALVLLQDVLATQRDPGAVNVAQCCVELARRLETPT
jgi:hypothetical protein